MLNLSLLSYVFLQIFFELEKTRVETHYHQNIFMYNNTNTYCTKRWNKGVYAFSAIWFLWLLRHIIINSVYHPVRATINFNKKVPEQISPFYIKKLFTDNSPVRFINPTPLHPIRTDAFHYAHELPDSVNCKCPLLSSLHSYVSVYVLNMI